MKRNFVCEIVHHYLEHIDGVAQVTRAVFREHIATNYGFPADALKRWKKEIKVFCNEYIDNIKAAST